MGIPGSLFYHPRPQEPFSFKRYGRLLETPIGVAAGPHTQLSQNIIAAWLCGARYMELKTIQTLDELEVSKPCIDMQDEGYNCEWSQELKVNQSFTEYLNAWIIIHILRKELGFSGGFGTLFNMSVGYNLEGILHENVQWFLSRMKDCTVELAQAKDQIQGFYPAIGRIDIPACISDHVTLSTMHGCPPGEIEKIGRYLIREKRLHTTIKLNPTLLGAEDLRGILNNKLGFSTEVPDQAFEHDLKYPEALRILASLKAASDEQGLEFNIKLTNTLESLNKKDVFPASESMMYLSGRALHPISIALARKLQNDLEGTMDISFSAGVDCFNIARVIACGMKPVTVCSDLLKPGGYGRLHQYIEHLHDEFDGKQARSIDDYILAMVEMSGKEKHIKESSISQESVIQHHSVNQAALSNLNNYADGVADDPAYRKHSLTDPSIKTSRDLGWFDCIHAPCTDTCPTGQDIPRYMHHTAQGDIRSAFETIFETNPFPSVTGMVCDHLCQQKCTRINYDEALHIREVKRYVAENGDADATTFHNRPEDNKHEFPIWKAAIIGAGPAGLSCGWFLRKAGFEVDVFEQKDVAGGMVSAAIPAFRLTSQAIETDIQQILASGVHLHGNHPVDRTRFEALRRDYDVLFLAAGAQQSVKLKIEGIESAGVIDPLEFLFGVRRDKTGTLGRQVVIVGGGNTAMDAARTAYRLVGKEGKVTIVYRRTVKEMPADQGEIEAVRNEGIRIMELTNPLQVLSADGHVTGLRCSRNVLALRDKDGRPAPISVPGSEFEIPCDTLIPAIGQRLDIDVVDPEQLVTVPGSYRTQIPKLYLGGDALRGASTAINAIGDGRKAAAEILKEVPGYFTMEEKTEKNIDARELMHRKAVRVYGNPPKEIPLDHRQNFDLVVSPLSQEEAEEEASRCLLCDEICNICVTVCPNLANFGYRVEPVFWSLMKAVLKEDGAIILEEDKIFKVDQPFQIMNIRDLCNECGNCTTFCPGSGRPFTDKPSIHLSVKSLNEEGNGFFLSRFPQKLVLIYKEKEQVKTLSLADGRYVYETNQVKATIHPDTFALEEVKFLTPCVREVRFEFAAEMAVIMMGAGQLEVTG